LKEQYKTESYLITSTEEETPAEIESEYETQIKNNELNHLEKKLALAKNELIIEEDSYNHLSSIFENSCNLVTRIMYQLEPLDVS
jgi:molecular chaperone GrpE (heat shock protein)